MVVNYIPVNNAYVDHKMQNSKSKFQHEAELSIAVYKMIMWELKAYIASAFILGFMTALFFIG